MAAHAIVLATAAILKNGERPNAKSKEKKRRPKGQSER